MFRGLVIACGGKKRLKAISHLVLEALWASLRSLPPKDAMVALVWRDMMKNYSTCEAHGRREGEVAFLEVPSTFTRIIPGTIHDVD